MGNKMASVRTPGLSNNRSRRDLQVRFRPAKFEELHFRSSLKPANCPKLALHASHPEQRRG